MKSVKPVKAASEIDSFKYAISGIINAYRRERHMRFHFFAALVVLVLAFLLRLSALEWVAIIFVTAMVLTFEMLNTAFEALVNKVSPEINPLAKYVKDVAAGAVLIMSIAAAATGCIIFLPKIIALLR